jgi:hypothetical protein
MSLPCRECGQTVPRDADKCPGCKCRRPFVCVECGRELGTLTVYIARSKKYPHGGFSREGQPLCHEHRLTRCHACEELFPAKVMKRRTIGQRADTHMRKGKPPRIEPVDAPFCPECLTREYEEREAPAKSGSLAWLFAVLAFGACVIVGALLILINKFGR